MAQIGPEDLHEWVRAQVTEYARLRPHYENYAKLLQQILKGFSDEIAPQSIVDVRAKSVESFAQKILRKKGKYRDPVRQLTDLCGARIITKTRAATRRLERIIEGSFRVDRENSLDTSQRLRPREFGYRSVHYVVSLLPDHDYGEEIPKECYDLKAEIQLRTFAEHAWAEFSHDLSYKGAFKLPEPWERELAGLAATLEQVEQAFDRMEERLRNYASGYGAYLTEPQMREEMNRLEIVLEHEPRNVELAARLGKFAVRLGDMSLAVKVLSPYVDPEHPERSNLSLLRDLGVALCKLHKKEPESEEFHRGQRYLEIASESGQDLDAVASFAGTWKGIDDARSRDLYRKATEIDPADPYPLGNFLEFELARDSSLLELLRPLVRGAVARCRDHIEAGINLPWAFYDLGKFQLLLGEAYESLNAYAKAILASTADFMIETSLASLERLAPAAEVLPGYEWVRRLLLVGLAARFPSGSTKEQMAELASPGGAPIESPVVIIAGGTDPRIEAEMRGYEATLLEGFADFAGTILSGGTTQGISGLVGDLASQRPESIYTIGYLPRVLPGDATPDTDPRRYRELRRTEGEQFTPLEPLQNWIDLITSDIPPREVRVLGINGGTISAAEYRIALGLGATVGLIAQSGREAGRLLADESWMKSPGLIRLPRDPQTIAAFVTPVHCDWPDQTIDEIARALHGRYLTHRAGSLPPTDRAVSEWNELSEELKESNRAQAKHIPAKLSRIGCAAEEISGSKVRSFSFSDEEIEALAEMEHGRWNVYMLVRGWSWGELRDHEKKTTPDLMSWVDLPERVKELDRDFVRAIPQVLSSAGLEIRRR